MKYWKTILTFCINSFVTEFKVTEKILFFSDTKYECISGSRLTPGCCLLKN